MQRFLILILTLMPLLFVAGCNSVPDYIGEDEKKLYDSLSDFQKEYATRTGLEAVKTVYLDTDKKVPMQFVLIPPSTSPEYKKYYNRGDLCLWKILLERGERADKAVFKIRKNRGSFLLEYNKNHQDSVESFNG